MVVATPPMSAESAVGRVFVADSGATLGSCFALADCTRLVTAGHVVSGLPLDSLRVAVGSEAAPLSVERVTLHGAHDLAVMRVPRSAIQPYWDIARPFAGEKFGAYGFPTELAGADPDRAVARHFRGHVQRVMEYSRLGEPPFAPAMELSIAAPAGLSGGPVFREERGDLVLGAIWLKATVD